MKTEKDHMQTSTIDKKYHYELTVKQRVHQHKEENAVDKATTGASIHIKKQRKQEREISLKKNFSGVYIKPTKNNSVILASYHTVRHR